MMQNTCTAQRIWQLMHPLWDSAAWWFKKVPSVSDPGGRWLYNIPFMVWIFPSLLHGYFGREEYTQRDRQCFFTYFFGFNRHSFSNSSHFTICYDLYLGHISGESSSEWFSKEVWLQLLSFFGIVYKTKSKLIEDCMGNKLKMNKLMMNKLKMSKSGRHLKACNSVNIFIWTFGHPIIKLDLL